ncbi:homoserine O-succinyltransferase [Xanthobacter agilis]|uniref:homoserine O-succinyltransferase n=1 Tax=Xanthobacter agilis TaxID=47492 RepID=UPI00372A7F76
MPIKIPDLLPARRTLEAENVMVMGEGEAVRQDIRPLRIALLNLMPDKIATEVQIARLLGATPLQVELTLVRLTDHVSRNTPHDHMAAFYRPWEEVRHERFDGLVITGAPVEHLPFSAVTYWDEVARVLDWTQTHVHRTFTICWAALAAVHHFHGMPKHDLPQKAFGLYRHRTLQPASPFLRGFPDTFRVPVSRWAEARARDIPADSGLVVLAECAEAGLCLIDDPRRRTLHLFNHLEYDTSTLANEYFRDAAKDPRTRLPAHYFPANDPSEPPENRWRGHAHLLFANWINEIYQTTPFATEDIGRSEEHEYTAFHPPRRPEP